MEEGGEKGGRDEGWREEEEVRRGWREGVERGSIGGCGRSIEFSEREEWRREECWIERLSIALSFEWARGWGGEMGLGGRFARARARARASRLVGASVALRLWAGREVEWEIAELGVGGWAE